MRVKGSRTVERGKDGDYIKFLPIVINVNDERKCGDFK